MLGGRHLAAGGVHRRLTRECTSNGRLWDGPSLCVGKDKDVQDLHAAERRRGGFGVRDCRSAHHRLGVEAQ